VKLSFRISLFWLPVLLWLAVIALESFFLSSNVTGSWIWRIVRMLHIPMSWNTFERFHHILRKTGHVTGYGILCVLVFRGWYRTLSEVNVEEKPYRLRASPSILRVRGAILAVGITLLTAVLDEWHQSFDPTRTSSIRDVGLDLLGGVFFLSVALFVFRLWRETSARKLEPVSA
jgi:VanZ family protein